MKSYDFVEIEVYNDEAVLMVDFERVTTWAVDGSYGADADGRRGVRTVFIEDDEATDIFVDGEPIKSQPEHIQKLVDKEIAAWLKKNEPCFDEGGI